MDIDDETAPLGATDITPSPEPAAIFVNPFEDVAEGDWYYDDVMYVANLGWMTGISTTPMWFGPDGHLTRAMIVTTLYRMENSPAITGLPNLFIDVAEDEWYTDAIIWASANDIIIGYGDGRFGPDDYATLEHLAMIIDRYADLSGALLPELREYLGFDDDADIADYAKASVARLYQAAIIEGKPGNIFVPRGNATRAEFAAMLHRYAETRIISGDG